MPAISMESGGRNEETSHHLMGAGEGSMALIVSAETWEKGGSTFNNQINIYSSLSTLPTYDLQFQLSNYFFAFLPSKLSVFGVFFLGTVLLSDFTTTTTPFAATSLDG